MQTSGRWLGTALERVADALSGLGTGNTSSAVLAVAAAGVIAAALVQLLKELTPARRAYQKLWVGAWLLRRSANAQAACAEEQLVHLATGDCAHAFYELPAEEMALHMNQAGQITLDDPQKYGALLGALAYGMRDTDLRILIDGPSGESSQKYFDARNRIARRIQRNIEGLRLGLGRDWRFWMQLASVAWTTLIVTGTVAYAEGADWRAVLLAVPVGFIGGYFAPITHDLARVIEKLRKRLP